METSLENLYVYIGAKTKLDHTICEEVFSTFDVLYITVIDEVISACWICLRRGSISNTNANELIDSSVGLKKEKRIGIGLQ